MEDHKAEKDSIETPPVSPDPEDEQRKKFRITIEPVGFLFLSAIIIQAIANPNLYLYKVCHVNFNMSDQICDHRNQTVHVAGRKNMTGLVDSVQSYVTTLEIYMTLITNIPSIFFVLFLGPWSDKYGRKWLMIVPLTGQILNTLVFMLNHFMTSWPAECILLAGIPTGILGGHVAFHMAIHRYMIDITTEENRTWRISFLSGIMGVAGPFAHFVSSYIYEYGGPLATWGTALALKVLTLLYVIFMVKESVNLNRISQELDIIIADGHNETNKQDIKKMSDDKEHIQKNKDNYKSLADTLKNVWFCFVVTFKKRPGYQRACICFLLIAVWLAYFIRQPRHVLYLYTRKMFSWDAPDFARYTTLNGIISVLGTLILLPLLSSFFKWKDGTIGTVSLLGNIASAFTVAFAVSPLMMYLSALGHILAAGISVATISMLSKVVGRADMSHVYSVVACVESIEPLIASPFFNLVYKSTLVTFPGCVFVIEASLLVVVLLSFVSVIYLQRKDRLANSPAMKAW